MNLDNTLLVMGIILVGLVFIIPSILFVRYILKRSHTNEKLNVKVTKIGIIYNLIFIIFLMAALSLKEFSPQMKLTEFLTILACVFLLGVIGEIILQQIGFKLYEEKYRKNV